MATARSRHTATLLRNGRVLVAGGYNSTGALNTAELFDPLSNTWTSAGQLTDARREHTATLLGNNTLLLTGGGGSLNDAPVRKTNCLYNDNSDWSSPVSPLNEGRFSHTATLLNDGRVLLAGGFGETITRLNSCRMIDSLNLQGGSWRLTLNPLNFSRSRQTATKLDDGRVLVIGGTGNTNRAELFDPSTEVWELRNGTNDLRTERHTATLLAGGRIMVVGGLGPNGISYKSTELYDPATNVWSRSGDLNTETRYGHTATLLAGGALLIAGGATSNAVALKTAEIYADNGPTAGVSGNVVDFVGRKFAPSPTPDIQLEILEGSSYVFSSSVTTSSSGAYNFTGLTPGRTYRISSPDLSGSVPNFRVTGPLTGVVTGMDFIARFPLVTVGGEIRDASQKVVPGVTVGTTVLGPAGSPASGASLDLVCLGADGLAGPCQSDSQGRYKVQLHLYGTYKVTLSKPGFVFNYTGPTPPGGVYTPANFNPLFNLLTENYAAVSSNPPAVSLTSPSDGAFFRTAESVTLGAAATDSDGSIKKVEFYYGATNRIGEATSAPFNFVWNNLKADTYRVRAVATDNAGLTTSSGEVSIIIGDARVSTVSAASYSSAAQAPEAIVAAFGRNLSNDTQAATTIPLPESLAGTKIRIQDSRNVIRAAPLFYVSPGQINYQIPPGTATGAAKILVSVNDSDYTVGDLSIVSVAPGIFTADSSGSGVAAAYLVRVRSDGSQVVEPVARYNGSGFVSVPIDLGPPGETVVLVLYGTGIRNRSSASAVTVTIGGANAPVGYADKAPGFVGLDQINVTVPRSLAGRNGEADVVLTADGKAANTVRVNIK
ncbi:MAG TPA: kelch repeat-containing protein [Blastocatellia bacterium]|nr:kelch repeat-containing protein [Blastocatellia bacterium]